MVSRVSAIDWLGYGRFRPGRYVLEKAAPRLDHAAQITAVHYGVTATVIYVKTGHRGELALADIELVEEFLEREASGDDE